MGHFEAAEEFLMRGHEGVEARQVLSAGGRRAHDAAGAGFQIFKDFWFGERKFRFVVVQDLEDDDLVAMKAELLEAEGDIIRWFEQIREEEDHAAAMHEANGVLEQAGEAGAARGAKRFELAEHQTELIGPLRRADEFGDIAPGTADRYGR